LPADGGRRACLFAWANPVLFAGAVGSLERPSVGLEEINPVGVSVVLGCGAVVYFVPDAPIFASDGFWGWFGCDEGEEPSGGFCGLDFVG